MALQDNLNAVYNKKEQARREREQGKQHDKTAEREYQEELQRVIEGYCEEHSKTDLYFLKTKKIIIEQVLENNDVLIPKNSKYYRNVENVKNYLYNIYDKTINKVLKIYRIIEREQEEAETIQNILIQEQETEQVQEARHGLSEDTKQNIRFIVLIIVLAPLFLLWGIIEGLCKRK